MLDIMLPKLDGLEVCKRLRATSTVPIIMLTARDDELDKVVGLELGADDYITKPFSIREFRSRVRALLRRAAVPRGRRRTARTVSSATGCAIDLARRDGRGGRAGRSSSRTSSSSSCARWLPARAGSSRRQMLLEALWGDSDYREPRTIDVHVRHLREKLERDPREPEFIHTVRGVGYRFREREPVLAASARGSASRCCWSSSSALWRSSTSIVVPSLEHRLIASTAVAS